MAGILDPKTRTLDFILTPSGRQMLAEKGQFVPEYISFSDDRVYYAKLSKTGSVAQDASSRLALEANTLTQDELYYVSGSDTSSSGRSERLITNLKDLRILTSVPSWLEGQTDFSISQENIEFVPAEEDIDVAITEDVGTLSAFFQDKHFQHVDNYKFLSPINSTSGKLLADYPKLNTDEVLTSEALSVLLENKKKELITFEGGLVPSNIMLRLLQQNGTSNSEALELIDYGTYVNHEGTVQRVFFAGKIYEDQLGVLVFVNLFTMVFT